MKSMTATMARTEADHGYPQLEALVRRRIGKINDGPQNGKKKLLKAVFTTFTDYLFPMFLESLPEESRQHYTCHCCRRFFERYGNLVTIDEKGQTWPLLWGPEGVPPFFQLAFARLWREVKKGKVTGVFLWSEKVWGTPQTGEWTHLSGEVDACNIPVTKTADQLMAEKLEDFKILKHALHDYTLEVVDQAARILNADALDRSEKTLGVARFFLTLHQDISDNKGCKDNLVWRAVASAPPGFCHIRSTMISTLLDDITAGKRLEIIQNNWTKKMHPLQYQRAQAEISEGQVKRANEIIAKLAAAGSLGRRFAKLSDITHRIWEPRVEQEVQKPQGGAFDHLLNKGKTLEIELPSKKMTWAKFKADILPDALVIEVMVPYTATSFCAFITALNPEAPCLFQWSNHVSWYLYHQGSLASHWNLTARTWHPVSVITCLPCHWDGPMPHQTEGIMLILPGARDLRHKKSGGWFPETLKAEYHEIRAAMEHYANEAAISGNTEDGSASGLLLQKGNNWSCQLRVKTRGGYARYELDRWD